MDIELATFEVMTSWSRDYVTISFVWIFELTNDISISNCENYLLRSSFFIVWTFYLAMDN